MIKGNERRVVIIRGTKDAIYDMACIFIKSEKTDNMPEDDIVKEAERIIESANIQTNREKEKKEPLFTKRMISFFLGTLSGCAVSYGTYILVSVLFSV